MIRRLRFWVRVLLLGRVRLADQDVQVRPWPLFATEAVACLVATVAFFGLRPAAAVDECGGREARLAFVQRSYAAMGVAISMIPPRQREQIREAEWAEKVAAFRAVGGTVYVSRNFFELLGIRPATGRFFRPDEPLQAAVLPYGQKSWRAVGTLPEGFRFVLPWATEYTVMPDDNRPTGVLVLLREGVTREGAERQLRGLLGSDVYKLAPYRSPVRWWDTVQFAMAVAGLAFLGTVVGLRRRRSRGSALYYGALAGRLVLSVLALSQVATLFQLWAARMLWPVTVMHLWAFVMGCVVVCWFTVRDHWNRCPECLARVTLPARFGRWDSLLLEVAATEWVCPHGHGLLYVNEVGNVPAKWTVLDRSWREVFGGRK